MMKIIGTNIISPLGFTTAQNFEQVKRGASGIAIHDEGTLGMPNRFAAALIDRQKLDEAFAKISSRSDLTYLEKAAILSVHDANMQAGIDLQSDRTIFILSTTKGNVDCLEHQVDSNENGKNLILNTKYLWHSARQISGFFGCRNTPMVVSNACISGACAQIAAMRCLRSGRYDHAVVVGADFLSKFIVSGFQTLKAMSPQCCMPFDKERNGLNLGEAAATIIFQAETIGGMAHKAALIEGCIRNDANHISAPSRSGEGSLRALKYVMQYADNEQIAFINAHGTATPYNDAMEAQAILRAGMDAVPTYSLKACFGHTLGAAGVVESIISMQALCENLVLKSLNFNQQEHENKINILTTNQHSDKKYFIKMLSGFGGCNAVLLFGKVEK